MTQEEILATPVGFAESILGLALYEWQARILTSLADPRGRKKVAVCTPNGAGKSERIIASAILRHLALYPLGKVAVTTKDARQLDYQIMPALRAHAEKFPEWRFNEREVKNTTGGFAALFTTDEPGRAEGWHKVNDETGPLLIIVDEAKSVNESIFMAIDRCTFNQLMLVSSPGPKTGRFYKAFQSDAFIGFKAGLSDCPHIPKEKIDDILATYGEDHPFTRSSLYGEFMEEDGDEYIFSWSDVRRCMDRETMPEFKIGDRGASCDFAGGRDENVLVYRTGNKATIQKAWREKNEMAAVGQFIAEFRKLKLEAKHIKADAGGAGKPMCARFDELGWPLHRINNNERANDDRVYVNRGTESWYVTADLCKRGEIILPDDEILLAQLTSRKRKSMDSKGRFEMESKDEMRKRGLKSPDRADAICMEFASMAAPSLTERYLRGSDEGFLADLQDYLEENEEYLLPGCHTGV